MRKKLLLGFGIPLALLIVGAVGTYVWIRSPVETTPYQDPVEASATEQNTGWQSALLAAGVDQAFVDVTRDTAYLAYDPPENAGMSPTDWQWLALGTAADAITLSERIVVVYYDGEDASLAWTVRATDLDAFANGNLERGTFESLIEVQHL